jgi:hypothetical protein
VAVPPIPLTELQDQAVERVARLAVRFGVTVPAILFLESMRPMSFVGSQAMLVLSPFVNVLASRAEWDALQTLLEDRRGIEVVIARIEEAAAAR